MNTNTKQLLSRQKHRLKVLLATAIIIAMSIFFWPAQLGGQMYYVILTGPSMEPGFHRGDLIIVRKATSYHAGDIVLYQNPRIGHVFHRIVGYDTQGRFRLKGDNNAWEDVYHPSLKDILGCYYWRIPALGTLLLDLHQPWIITLVALIIAILVWDTFWPLEETLSWEDDIP